MRNNLLVTGTLVMAILAVLACTCGSSQPPTAAQESPPPTAPPPAEDPAAAGNAPPDLPATPEAVEAADAGAPPVPAPAPEAAPTAETPGFSVMTYNLRHMDLEDARQGRGWLTRRELILQLLREHSPDIIAVQELSRGRRSLTDQVNWFRDKLGAGLGDVRVPRYDVIKGGTRSPKDIYVNAERFTVVLPARDPNELNTGKSYRQFGGCRKGSRKAGCTADLKNTLYLPPDKRSPCESSFEMSKAKGTGAKRAATWAVLRDNRSGKQFFLMNLHLFHEQKPPGDEIRREQLRCVREQLEKRAEKLPVLVMGDFNLTKKAAGYRIMLDGFAEGQRPLYDTHGAKGYGSINKFCADCDPVKKIDFIMARGFRVVKPSITVEKKYNGQWPSDHCPVLVSVDFASDPGFAAR